MRRPGHKHTGKGCVVCTLDQTGLRVTKQRQVLFETLKEESGPLSAEQIYSHLKLKGVEVNQSTIYRILEQFVTKGLILKTLLQDEGKALYGINTHEHQHHLICTSCKQILTVSGCPLETYDAHLEKLYGYQVTGHKLEVYGVCPACQGKVMKGSQ